MELKLLRTYDSPAIAYIDKGFLEANGIPCIVEEDALNTIYPGSFPLGIRLLVESSKLEEAKKLMSERPLD